MAMASVLNDYLCVIWEAAHDPDFPDNIEWPQLKGFLKAKRVNLDLRRQEDWIGSFNRFRQTLLAEEKVHPEYIKYIDAIWEAACDPDFSDNIAWLELKGFLKGKGIDFTQRQHDEWIGSFNRFRRTLQSEQSVNRGGRSPSTESERKADVASLADSYTSYGSDPVIPQSKSGRPPPQVIFLKVKPCDEYPDGKAGMGVVYCDDEEDSYILETIFEKHNLSLDASGKVTLEFWTPEGDIFVKECGLRPYNVGPADVAIGTKPSTISTTAPEEDEEDTVGIRHSPGESRIGRELSASRNFPERQKRIEVQENMTFAVALGTAYQHPDVQARGEEGADEMGKCLSRAVRQGTQVLRAPREPEPD